MGTLPLLVLKAWCSVPIFLKELNMAVKHTPTRVVHQGAKGGTTGCGVNTNTHASHWVSSSERITCDKNGCKN